ncbi:MAG: radical SAM protein, partial [Candidatus Omnitrophica bacterium]|nr:radical SAM protein [Candidatus Omnitrophota bacterium]
KRKKMHTLMITNGSLLEARALELVESGLDELNVSLDGLSQLHDDIRGLPGLYNTITRGLKNIDYLKKQKKTKKPFVNLQCTINKDNCRYLEEMIRVAEEVDADSLTFHNLIFTDRQILDRQKEYNRILDCNSLNWEGFVFEPGIEPEILNSMISRILKGRYKFSVDFYPNFSGQAAIDYYRDPANIPKGYPFRCLSPWIVAYVFPDGEVRPCLNFSYSYGNIKKVKFTKLWNNEQAVKFRRILKENKVFAVCGRCTELYRY